MRERIAAIVSSGTGPDKPSEHGRPIARLQQFPMCADSQVGYSADRHRQDVLVRKTGDFPVGQAETDTHVVHERLVMGELGEQPLAPKIGAAVPYICNHQPGEIPGRDDHRRTHPRTGLFGARPGQHGQVRLANGFLDGLFLRRGEQAIRKLLVMASTVIAEAISPQAAPPMPSATMARCRFGSMHQLSSLFWRTKPGSVAPQASSVGMRTIPGVW